MKEMGRCSAPEEEETEQRRGGKGRERQPRQGGSSFATSSCVLQNIQSFRLGR